MRLFVVARSWYILMRLSLKDESHLVKFCMSTGVV